MDTVTDQNTVAEIKAYLDAHDISYPSGATKSDLLALVPEQHGTMTAAAEEEPAEGDGTEPEEPTSVTTTATPSSVSVNKGKTTDFVLNPAISSGGVFNVADETIATVKYNSAGRYTVSGVKDGTTSVEITDPTNTYADITVDITVTTPVVPVTGISMAEDNATTGNVGTDIVLGAIIAPENATNQNMDWVSSDESLAAFTKTGAPAGHKILSLLKAGQVTVTVTTEDGSKSISQTIDITEPVVIMTGFDLDKTSLSGETGGAEIVTLSNVQPANVTDKLVDAVLDDGSIVSVQDNGDSTYTVNFLSAGSTTIHWNSRDGGATVDVPVNVTDPAPIEPELEQWEIMLINHDSTPHPAPPVDTYTVKTGDTLASIATEHMMSLARLKKLNGLTVNVLPAGRVIRLS